MTTKIESAAGRADAPTDPGGGIAVRLGVGGRIRPYLTALLVLLAGCAITLVLFVDVRRQYDGQLQDEFQDQATAIHQLLQRAIDWHVDVLTDLTGLFDATAVVSEAEFRAFVAPALERQPRFHLLGWAPRVGADEWERRGDALHRLNAVGIVDPASGAAYPAWPGRDVFPVVLGAPVPEAGLTIGADLSGDIFLRTAMAWARDSGLPTASRPVTLPGRDGTSRGVVIFDAIYRRGSDPIDYVQRREALTGYVVLAVTVDDLVDWTLENLPPIELDIQLRDAGMPGLRSFIYYFDAERQAQLSEPPVPPRQSPFAFHQTPLQVAARAWGVQFMPTERFVGQFESLQPIVVLVVGLVLSALLALYVQREVDQTQQIKALVRIRTAELEEEVAKRRHAQAALRLRVDELEETRDSLERQGRQLAEFARDLGLARDKADAANAAKSAFLATMSHELRTPLNAIIGFSELIRDELAGDIGDLKYCDYARDIHASGQHLLALINDILDVSKAEAGKLEINDELCDVVDAVRSCIRLCQTRADSTGIRLSAKMPDELPLLRADRRRLKQILINLLTNALNFTEGSGSVIVRGYVDKAGWMAIEVRDSGIGMTESEIGKAMEPFGQVDTAINRKHPGTGLGLPLTKSMVEVHGGRLVIESTVGEGTVVSALFPAQRVVRDRPGQQRRDMRAAASQGD